MALRKKILIDTDIGDNLDDAFAILAAMALEFEIVGITTVFRDTNSRARMAKKLLSLFGRGFGSVSVYAGFSAEEENTAYPGFFGADLASDTYAPANTDPEDATDFIIRCCRQYQKELTVVALGPFCNMAKVIAKDPQALPLADRVVIMGGAYFMQYADWNVSCDVTAADTMFRNLPNLECIGADVTHQLTDTGYLEEALTSVKPANDAFTYVAELYRLWRRQHPKEALVLHDVLVLYYLYDPTICTMQKIRAAVITEGLAKGLTLNIDSYGKTYLNSLYQALPSLPRISAAADVDVDKFHRFVLRDISACRQAEKDS